MIGSRNSELLDYLSVNLFSVIIEVLTKSIYINSKNVKFN